MTTPILDLDEWEEAQAQPNIVVNESVRWLECFASLSVFSQSVADPPTGEDGDVYIVAPGATGEWAGHDGKIALRMGNVWDFRFAPEGSVAFVQDENIEVRYRSSNWLPDAGQPYLLSATILMSDPTSPRFIVPSDGNITAWAVHAEGGPGDCELDVRKSAGASTPPSGPGDSITGGGNPNLSGESGRSEPTTAWATEVSAFEVIEIVILSIDTNITALHVQLVVTP